MDKRTLSEAKEILRPTFYHKRRMLKRALNNFIYTILEVYGLKRWNK